MTLSSSNIPRVQDVELLLKNHLENLSEYEEAKNAYYEFILSGQKGIPFEEVFKNVK